MYFKLEKDIVKDGKIGDVFFLSFFIFVQVVKELIFSKGLCLCFELILVGRYLVFVFFFDKIFIFQKIKLQEECDWLKDLMSVIKLKNFGVIICIVVVNKKVEVIDVDLKGLFDKWKLMYIELCKVILFKCVFGEIDKMLFILWDLLNGDFFYIYINDEKFYNEVKEYVVGIVLECEKIVCMYDGRVGIFECFGINKQIKIMFGKKVLLLSGGYLIIEYMEVMYVIDVNFGNCKGVDGQEFNVMLINFEVVEEIVCVFQFRDMGGIVCIDFIDMYDKENNKVFFE